jgi:chemotaxis protein MotA
MEKASYIGTLASIGVLLGGIIFSGGNPLGFIDPAAGIIICGGVLCVVMTSFSIDEFMRLPAVCKIVFSYQKPDLLQVINQITELSESARRSGILSLDSAAKELDDHFLAAGLQMAIDGMSPEVLASVLEQEIEATGGRHSVGAEMMSTLGKCAPVFGLIATLLGLILMLAHMDPDTIGHHMSVALTGTLYGVATANLFFLPYASKLRYFNKQEIIAMEMKMLGILAIQSGESPRVVKLKLLTFIPDRLRPKEEGNE